MQQPAKCSLLCCQCTDTYPVHPFRDRHDLSLFLPVVCHCIKRRFLILYTGNASLQTSPDRKGDPALCYRPYFICPWKSCCRSRSCRAYPVAFSKCVPRRDQSAFPDQPYFRSPWPPAGYGRRYPYSFYPWTSRQRDRPSHYPYGLYSPGESDGILFHTPAKADPYSKRLDLDHRSVRHALLPDALAMLHHPYHYL